MPLRTDGIFAALWTPTDENGRVLEPELKHNLQFIKAHGAHGIMALGSTGEFLHFDVESRKRLLETTIANAGSLPVIANVSDIRPPATADLGRFARTAGAAAVALLPPYFYPLSQDDLVEFFVQNGKAAGLPVMLYNFPERTGNRIDLETVAAVADRLPLAGVKQSGGEFDYHVPLVKLGREKNFVVFTGADTRLAEAMSLGVVGCVSGLANAVPDLIVEIFDAVKHGTPQSAARATERMAAIGKLIDRLTFPLNVAAAMEARGLAVGHPKAVVSPNTRSRYEQLVGELRNLFREWKLI